MQRIVAAMDFSGASQRAVDLAADLAVKYGATLMLLHVVHDTRSGEPIVTAYAQMEHIRNPDLPQQLETERERLETLCDGFHARGVKKATPEVTIGNPAETIIQYAKEQNADLLVLGSRGHGRLAGLLLGSVTQKLVGLSPCPVLVVH